MHLLQDALNGPVRLRADVFCEYCTNLKISRVKGYLTYFKISFPMKFLRISLYVGGKKYSDNELYSGINPEVLLHSSSLHCIYCFNQIVKQKNITTKQRQR